MFNSKYWKPFWIEAIENGNLCGEDLKFQAQLQMNPFTESFFDTR
jgi:hypothetical protein